MSNSKLDLLITDDFDSETVERLGQWYTTHKLWTIPDPDEKLALLASISDSCQAVATPAWVGEGLNNLPYERVDEGFMTQLPLLKIIVNYGVGYDSIDTMAAESRGVAVTNTPGVLTDDVADFAIGLVLGTSRLIVNGDRYVRDRIWLNGPMRLGRSITGKKLGIVGLGRIGTSVAERAVALKMSVSYHNRNRRDVPYVYYEDVVSLARDCDVLLLLVPATPQTKKMVNLDVMNALGPEGTLVNVARGSVVDEAGLIHALREGHLGAAGLDVYEDEPNVPQALIEMNDRVVLQPHQASGTTETRRAMGQLLIDNLAAHFSGRELLTSVH